VTILVTTHYMDEAEYCHRVGMMRAGKLLAMDTPQALKAQYVPGEVVELYTTPPMAGLAEMSASPLVHRVGLAGDNLRVIVKQGVSQPDLKQALEAAGVPVQAIQVAEASLEDVFLHLAQEKALSSDNELSSEKERSSKNELGG
jgi:ABC-2 type transport system ATP-binding protein